MSLTDEERDSLRDAAFDAFGDYPDGLNELVESIVTARVAAALREAAKRPNEGREQWAAELDARADYIQNGASPLYTSALRDAAKIVRDGAFVLTKGEK